MTWVQLPRERMGTPYDDMQRGCGVTNAAHLVAAVRLALVIWLAWPNWLGIAAFIALNLVHANLYIRAVAAELARKP